MNTIKLTVIGLVILGAAGCAADASVSDPSPAVAHSVGVKEAAHESLGTLKEIVRTAGAGARNFQSAEEVSQAEVGEPLPIVTVGRDPLAAYQVGDDPKNLLGSRSGALALVSVAGQARSTVELRQIDGRWQVVAFGMAKLAQSLAVALPKVEVMTGGSRASASLVEIPALSIRMLSYARDGEPWLTMLGDVSAAGLRAGQSMPAGEALLKLADLARRT